MVDKPVFDLTGIENSALPNLGYYVCVGPRGGVGEETLGNQLTEINYTGKPGTASGIYYSLFFQLPKWDWFIQKGDEWIEVHPTHKEYYERTMATKQMLESTIKTGLASAAQAVSDFELLSHDLRKYKEILGYFAKEDEHSLKSMFIDQVDVHTGNLSIADMTRNRWPTMTADFHRLKDEDMDIDKIMKRLKISRAEAIILVTKNKLYVDWKDMFRKAVRDRYERLRGLTVSREKSVEEYKEWLKPYIARFKTTKLGTAESGVRPALTKSFMDVAGLSTFLNEIRMYSWKPLLTREHRRPSGEIRGEFGIHPYDSYIRNNVILGGNFKTDNVKIECLADTYQWLRNARKYCGKCKKYYPSGYLKCSACGSADLENKTYADEIVETQILDKWDRWGTDRYELYYMFLDIKIERLGIRLPSGELEDITFTNRMFVISQNVLLVKILELICRDLELERYIEEMLGFKRMEKSIDEILIEELPRIYGKEEKVEGMSKFSKELKDAVRSYTSFFKKLKLPKTRFMFAKPGRYESHLRDRITKQYLSVSGSNFGQISSFIKSKMGME